MGTHHRIRRRAPKTPISARSWVPALLLSLVPAAVDGAPWTEAEIIRRARDGDPAALLARAEAALARAETIAPGLYPNPSIEWEREATVGSAGATDDFLRVEIPIALSGRRPAQSALARSRAEVAEAQSAQAMTAALENALRAFYAVVYAEQRSRIFQTLAAALEEAARVLARREEQGTASGYERARLDLEAELARSDLHEAENELVIARRTLASILGEDTGEAKVEVLAELTTGPPGALEGLIERATTTRALLRHQRRAAEEAEDARARAAWAWIPSASLTGGARRAGAQSTEWGYVAGLSLEIPLSSRGQDVRAEAEAKVAVERARLARIERDVRIEVASAFDRLVLARRELERLDAVAASSLDALERAAESGYREGARTIVELIDAQRARRELELRRFGWMSRARSAEISLRGAVGELE